MGFFDFFKKKKSDSVDPNLQIIFFENGKLIKVQGNDESSWYDADIVVSDGIRYNLSNEEEISRIPVPIFSITDTFDGYGATGMLDYVLRMKSACCFNKGEKRLCSALLWKSTELMFENKFCCWRNSDYFSLIDWHVQMGMNEEAEKAREYLLERGIILLKKYNSKPNRNHVQSNTATPKKQEMTSLEKELFLVQKVTLSDIKELTSMPFVWNTDIQKHIKPGSHPYAYMDIIEENIKIAGSELNKINLQIEKDALLHTRIPKNARIPIADIVYKKSEKYGYTKILCTPKTLTGKIAKHPIKMFFTTDLSKTSSGGDTTHGELVYNKNGLIASANIYCWRNNRGVFFYYKTIDGVLTLQNLEIKNISI